MFNALVPEFDVSNYRKSFDFYTKIVGFSLEYDRSNPSFALLSYGQAQIMIQEQDTGWPSTGELKYPYGRGVNFQFTVSDIHTLEDRFYSNQYPVHRGIEEIWRKAGNQLVGELEIHVLDPDGYFLRFSQVIGRREI